MASEKRRHARAPRPKTVLVRGGASMVLGGFWGRLAEPKPRWDANAEPGWHPILPWEITAAPAGWSWGATAEPGYTPQTRPLFLAHCPLGSWADDPTRRAGVQVQRGSLEL